MESTGLGGRREKERQGKIINRQGGLSSDIEEMVVFESASSKSERGMVLVEMW